MITDWTGRTACVLQSALRMSDEAFAAHLGVGLRTVKGWHEKPERRQQSEKQQILDTALARASADAKDRFAALAGLTLGEDTQEDQDDATADAEQRLISDQNISGALMRLDQLAGWEPGTARRHVAARLVGIDRRDVLDRADRRRRIGQRSMADALGRYYGDQASEHGRYAGRCTSSEMVTSILTRPAWLDLGCALTFAHDKLRLTRGHPSADALIGAAQAGAAVGRLAEILTANTRFTDMPLYTLTDINVRKGEIDGSLGITQFASYALTLDLLEGELADALAQGVSPEPGSLPLRDAYLPEIATVLAVGERLCAGGALALCAFARPADPYRGPADYALLLQERSGSVLNAARQLAVIPKGFHQPLTDFRSDAKVSATLRREMEEELFARQDLDTIGTLNAADPMHPARLSAPMRWLLFEAPDSVKMECTGFGLNLVSGNYEFACLIVVESEDFWIKFGGEIEASWESASLRQYSSLDRDALSALGLSGAWSNEGLFAFLQGIRRLRQIGGDRVDLPGIDWTIRL